MASNMDVVQLSKIAIEAAKAAGTIIRQHMDKDIAIEQKKGGTSYASQVVTEVDKACEKVIFSHLLPSCDAYNLALLSEETEDDGSRFEKKYFWCIDPMDGTLPFIEKRPGFAVSIALIAQDGTPQIGVVYDPSTDQIYHALKGGGAYKNGRPWKLKYSQEYLTYVTDRNLSDTPRANEIKQMLREKAAQLNLKGIKEMAGSGSVLNGIHVLENGPACLLKFPKKEVGGGAIWDFAATVCMCKELGVSATNYAGEHLDLNRKGGTYMNHEGVFYANFGDS